VAKFQLNVDIQVKGSVERAEQRAQELKLEVLKQLYEVDSISITGEQTSGETGTDLWWRIRLEASKDD
jgi:hypothetical protein